MQDIDGMNQLEVHHLENSRTVMLFASNSEEIFHVLFNPVVCLEFNLLRLSYMAILLVKLKLMP